MYETIEVKELKICEIIRTLNDNKGYHVYEDLEFELNAFDSLLADAGEKLQDLILNNIDLKKELEQQKLQKFVSIRDWLTSNDKAKALVEVYFKDDTKKANWIDSKIKREENKLNKYNRRLRAHVRVASAMKTYFFREQNAIKRTS